MEVGVAQVEECTVWGREVASSRLAARTIWDRRFMEMAKLVASWSKDPSTKCGAVIVDAMNRVVSLGFNGFPRGVTDDERLNRREEKYKIVLHAEDNALSFAQRDLAGCRIYIWPFVPCSHCASKIIQAGISEVIFGNQEWPDRWAEDFKYSLSYLRSANVLVNCFDDP